MPCSIASYFGLASAPNRRILIRMDAFPDTKSDQPSPGGVDSPIPSDAPDGAESSLKLTPEQVKEFGLENCQPGDIYSATIKFRMNGDGDFEPISMADAQESGEEGMEAPEAEEDDPKKPRYRKISGPKSPAEMGLEKDDEPVAP
jgi:hypothetical protein